MLCFLTNTVRENRVSLFIEMIRSIYMDRCIAVYKEEYFSRICWYYLTNFAPLDTAKGAKYKKLIDLNYSMCNTIISANKGKPGCRCLSYLGTFEISKFNHVTEIYTTIGVSSYSIFVEKSHNIWTDVNVDAATLDKVAEKFNIDATTFDKVADIVFNTLNNLEKLYGC